MFSSVLPSPSLPSIPSFLLWPPLSQPRTTRLIIVGGALHCCDAWTSLHRLYGVAERLILLVVGGWEGWEEGREERSGQEGVAPPPSPPAPPPLGLLGVGVGGWCWAGGQYRGSQHIVLPSQPVCNLSHVCNECWKKDCGEKKGGGGGEGVGEKRTVRGRFWSPFFSFFSPRLWQTRD